MRKRGLFLSLLSTVIFLSLLLTYNPEILLARQNHNAKSEFLQPENIKPGAPENLGQPPFEDNGRPGGKMKPPVPPVLYIGYAIKSESEFEMACVNFFPPAPELGKKNIKESKLKKPSGTIEIGKENYFIVEAKIEKQDASQQIFPEQAKKRGIKPPEIIKSCSAKISSTYFEMPDAPPAPGQGDKMKMPEGKANIVGDINLNTVEKEAGQRKLVLINGTININGEKYNLYLEPRIIQMPHRGGKGFHGPEHKQSRPEPENDNQQVD